MNLRDAFAGIEEARRPEDSGTQAPKTLSAEETKPRSAEVPRTRSAEDLRPPRPEAPRPLGLQGTAKSKHPDFEPVKIYLRKQTRKDAWRRWEDAQGGDFSDLVQMLLEQYLGA